MKKIKKKKAGFTLVETLVSVVILILLSAVAAKGVSVAVDAYSRIVNSANAQLLLSTTISEIRDELSTGTDIVIDNNSIAYQSSKTGDESIIDKYVLNAGDTSGYADGAIIITEYVNYGEEIDGSKIHAGAITRLLVSNEAANKNLVCTYDDVDYTGGVITINNLKVTRVGSTNVLAGLDKYMVKAG